MCARECESVCVRECGCAAVVVNRNENSMLGGGVRDPELAFLDTQELPEFLFFLSFLIFVFFSFIFFVFLFSLF